jgi:hypothetical protein
LVLPLATTAAARSHCQSLSQGQASAQQHPSYSLAHCAMPDKYRGPHSTHTHQHTWRASLTHAASGRAAPSPQTALRPPLLPNGASSGQQESSHVALSTQCHGCAVRPQRPTASRHTQQQEQPTASSAHTIHSTQAQGRPRYPQPKASALSAAAPAHQGPAAGNRPGESHAQVLSPPWRGPSTPAAATCHSAVPLNTHFLYESRTPRKGPPCTATHAQ